MQLEKGLADNPLELTWLTGEPPNMYRKSVFDFSAGYRGSPKASDRGTPTRGGLFPSAPQSPFGSIPQSKPPPYLPKVINCIHVETLFRIPSHFIQSKKV